MRVPASITHKLLSVFLLFSILFYSCKEKNSNTNVKALEEGLINSNHAIELSSEMAMHMLKNKLDDPRTSSTAGVWYPSALKIQQLSKEIIMFIEVLKKVKEPDDTKIAFLYDRLKKYKEDVLATDSSISKTFNNNLVLTTTSFDVANPGADEFKKTFFDQVTDEERSAILSRFQNNIRIIENKLLNFCNESIGVTWSRLD